MGGVDNEWYVRLIKKILFLMRHVGGQILGRLKGRGTPISHFGKF